MMIEKCPTCHNKDADIQDLETNGPPAYKISCPTCGKYRFTDFAYVVLLSQQEFDENRWLLSAILRENSEQNHPLFLKSEDFIKELLDTANEPRDPLKQMDILLLHICRKNVVIGLGKSVPFNPAHDYPLAFAKDLGEFRMIMFSLAHMGLIKGEKDGTSAQPRPDGWKRFRELQAKEVQSNLAFVAMSFSNDLDPAWSEGIKPALKDLYFKPYRTKEDEHNEDISDKIIAGIKKSFLVVADFTENRRNVYFEAGYAEGLGRWVVKTCRKDEVDDLAFDTRNKNHVIWEDPADLKQKLIDRIQATIPLPNKELE